MQGFVNRFRPTPIDVSAFRRGLQGLPDQSGTSAPASLYTSSLWTKAGRELERQGDKVCYDLGDGVQRIDGPQRQILLGVTYHGVPAAAQREANGQLRIQIDHDPLAQQMALDAQSASGPAPTPQAIAGTPGTFQQFPLGPHGTQRTLITPDATRTPVTVFSQGALPVSTVASIDKALEAMPPAAFDGGRASIYVVDWTGEWDFPGRDHPNTFGGLTFGPEGQMFLPRDNIQDPDDTPFAIWHETGHFDDALWGHNGNLHVDEAREPDGTTPLYRTSGESLNADDWALYGFPQVDRLGPKDDYVSNYAASSAPEDLAESHSLAIALRTEYHPGDLFSAPDADATAWLKQHHLSDRLTEKVEDIIHQYQHPAPSQ